MPPPPRSSGASASRRGRSRVRSSPARRASASGASVPARRRRGRNTWRRRRTRRPRAAPSRRCTSTTSYRPGARCAFSRILTDSRSRPPVSLRDHVGVDRAERGQLRFAVPVMIEDGAEKRNRGEPGADLRALVRVVHRDVRALRDQHVERCRRRCRASICDTSGNSSGVLSSRVRSETTASTREPGVIPRSASSTIGRMSVDRQVRRRRRRFR